MSTRTRLGRSPIPPPADRYLQITPGRKVPRKGAATRCHALTLSLPFQPSGRVSWRQGREHAPGAGETQGVLRSAAVLLKFKKASRPAPYMMFEIARAGEACGVSRWAGGGSRARASCHLRGLLSFRVVSPARGRG